MTTRLREPARSRVLAEIKAEYESGRTIRQVAGRIGFSYTATRNMLLSAGVRMRPRHCHKAPVVVREEDVNPLAVACSSCHALPWNRCKGPYGTRSKQPHLVRRRDAVQQATHPA